MGYKVFDNKLDLVHSAPDLTQALFPQENLNAFTLEATKRLAWPRGHRTFLRAQFELTNWDEFCSNSIKTKEFFKCRGEITESERIEARVSFFLILCVERLLSQQDTVTLQLSRIENRHSLKRTPNETSVFTGLTIKRQFPSSSLNPQFQSEAMSKIFFSEICQKCMKMKTSLS